MLSRFWSSWQDALAFGQPRTVIAVIAWQQQRFCDNWRRVSRGGTPRRPTLAKEVRDLMRTMWQPNPTWRAPQIVGELRKLGIDVAKATGEKYRVRPRKPPSPTWKTCLEQHVKDIVTRDCFPVPTVTGRVLCRLVLLAHARRRSIHCNVTAHPTAQWTAQQVVEACPWDEAPPDLLRARDCISGAAFRQRERRMGSEEVVMAPRSPWQHPYGERLLGSSRHAVRHHVLVLHARHVQRSLTSHVAYAHRGRCHLSLAMACPQSRPVHPPERGKVTVVPEVGGLHHHYERRAAYGACGGAEGFVTPMADAPLLLPRMDTNIARTSLASGRIVLIGAEYCRGVHDGSPLLAVPGSMPSRSNSGPPFLLQVHLTMVEWRATVGPGGQSPHLQL